MATVAALEAQLRTALRERDSARQQVAAGVPVPHRVSGKRERWSTITLGVSMVTCTGVDVNAVLDTVRNELSIFVFSTEISWEPARVVGDTNDEIRQVGYVILDASETRESLRARIAASTDGWYEELKEEYPTNLISLSVDLSEFIYNS